MGGSHGPSRRTGAICVLVVVLAFALVLPSAAAAATTRFSYLRPIANSSTNNPKPRVSVVVYDSQGVRGARGDAYTMSVDRAGVPVKMYRYRGYGYRKFKLYYDPRSPLADGSHRVHVMIRDLRGNVVRKTWYFRVDTIAPVTAASAALPDFPGVFVLGLSAADSGSGVSRTFWQFDDGPIMEGTLAWGNLGVGSHTLKYWSRDRAGNIETVRTLTSDVISRHTTPASACSTSGCHKDGLADIHWAKGCDPCHGTGIVPSSDCVSCHGDYHAGSGGHPTIASSGSDPACTAAGCHGTDAVATHPTCATCHDAADPDVLAVITAPGDAVCEDCHGVDFMHPGAALAHENTAAGGCKTVGCHNVDAVDTIHADPGCAVCHKVEAGYTLTKVCVTCHTVSPPKHTAGDHVSIPNDSEPSCQDALCHGTSLITTASKTTHASCATCHDGGVQWDKVVPGATQCETCHGDYTAIHGSADATHAWTNAVCAKSGCHPSDIADVHTTWASPPGCFDSCHGPGKTPSANCTLAGCHPASGFEEHNHTHQDMTGNFCIASGCHSGTTVLNVDPGHTPNACFCHSYASDDLNAVIESGAGGATVKCSDCHRGAQAPHGAAHAAIDKTDSTPCIACHGSSYYTVGSRLTEDGTVTVPADLDAPVLEHQGCSCHDYGYGGPDNPSDPGGQWTKDTCVQCHAGVHAPHGFDMLASGHSTSIYGYRGMREYYDGSQEATVFDTRGDPIEGEWAIPTARVFWTPGATNTPEGAYLGEGGLGLDAESEITCRDCHSALPETVGDPHGAQEFASAAIDPDYPVPYRNAVLGYYQTGTATRSDGTTFTLMPSLSGINYRTSWETTYTGDLRDGTEEVICAKCHDLWEENAAGTASADATAAAFFGWGNFVHEEHSRINALGRGDCVNCHAAIPHGWRRPRLLLQTYTGEVTYSDGTTDSVVGDAYPYANPRGYYAAGAPNGGWGSRLPEFNGAISGLGLLPAVWGDNPDTERGYVVGGPGDHPPIEIGPFGEMTSSFIAPEWQERTSDCQAGCGGSTTRHPKTVQGSFIE